MHTAGNNLVVGVRGGALPRGARRGALAGGGAARARLRAARRPRARARRAALLHTGTLPYVLLASSLLNYTYMIIETSFFY